MGETMCSVWLRRHGAVADGQPTRTPLDVDDPAALRRALLGAVHRAGGHARDIAGYDLEIVPDRGEPFTFWASTDEQVPR